MNDLTKLRVMLDEEQKFDARLYSAGIYWRAKTKRIAKELKSKGLVEFRGYDSGVGTSYCDNVVTDLRNEVYSGVRGFIYRFCRLPPFSRILDSQAALARGLHKDAIFYKTHVFEQNPAIKELLSKYKLENTTGFGCVDKVKLNGKEYACHYFEILNTHSFIAQRFDFAKIRSMFEIGGGFGANVHILLQNYKNIRKVFYLDMVPNLMVGTAYLKSLFGDAVVEFKPRPANEKIKFKNNDDLEIICIAPWQIENLDSKIDYFHNAHSFVEMPIHVVENYVKFVRQLTSETGRIALVSYDRFDPETTFDPNVLNSCFDNRLVVTSGPAIKSGRRWTYFLSS